MNLVLEIDKSETDGPMGCGQSQIQGGYITGRRSTQRRHSTGRPEKAVSARNGNSRNMSELLVMVHNAKKNYGYPLVN